MNVTLRQLNAFINVAETGSFTRASDKMHLTQSAVSGLIKELCTRQKKQKSLLKQRHNSNF
ncbi:LysR family transcriptional regulator [Psychrobacter sanguinis]|uniref:LysR family transcriptional regulator n=1 Tax=Psychrobacter sanguinis TaxID=861445 RepID=UPI001918AF98|nr:LysR family transcriptional regulator [Psychrobacter sanguinis]